MLIQEIRAKQALEEKGIEDYTLKIDHQTPTTELNGKKYTLIFPKSLLKYNEGVEKDIEKLFIGLVTEKRKKFLKNFEDAAIFNSRKGRNTVTKRYDESYFKNMARTKFTICPNGDFVWTYRFFEAILFKSIPIIEQEYKHYQGYSYYKVGDEYKYDEKVVECNLQKLKKEMMLW